MKKFRFLVTLAIVFGAASCESLKMGSKSGALGEVPADGLLGAKLAALQYAMDNLPAEDRRYLDDDYAAFGLLDNDPLSQRALVTFLKGRTPPVVDASKLYSRSSNSQWIDGKPALKWTASATKDKTHAMRAEVVVGWMHSQIINQFTTYVLEFDGKTWTVVDVQLLTDAEADLAP